MISNNTQHSSQKSGTTVSKTLDEEELDKLLQGLDQLTETLPDLSSPTTTNQQQQQQQQQQLQQQPKMETLNSHSLYSNSNGINGSSAFSKWVILALNLNYRVDLSERSTISTLSISWKIKYFVKQNIFYISDILHDFLISSF